MAGDEEQIKIRDLYRNQNFRAVGQLLMVGLDRVGTIFSNK